MHVLIASDFFKPFIGGTERQVQLLGKHLVSRGHKVSLATVWHTGLAEHESEEQVDLYRLKGWSTSVPWFSTHKGRRYHPPFPDPGIVLGLRKLIRAVKPDLIHANGWIAYSCAIALIGQPIPFIVSVRDQGYSCATRLLLHNGSLCSGPVLAKCLACAGKSYGAPKGAAATLGVFFGRVLLRQTVDVAQANSSFVGKVVQRDLFRRQDKARIVRIPDFYDPASTSVSPIGEEPPKGVELLPSRPYILFVGSLQAHKGVYILLDAYKRLATDVPLVLIGTTWKDSPNSYPPGVTVLHNVPHSVVMAAWKQCLFGVAPSVCPESFGGVLVEAMAHGKAVITSNIGGQTDVVGDGESGLLVPPGDVESLMRSMECLLNDQDLRERLGRGGLERVRRFTADAVLPQFEQLYHVTTTV